MKKRIGEAGRTAERKLGKRIGMAQTPASGAAGLKGDLRDDKFLLEAKSTTSDGYRVTTHELAKIHGEAMAAGKLPAFALQFTDLSGEARMGLSWVAVPEWVWKQMQVVEDE